MDGHIPVDGEEESIGHSGGREQEMHCPRIGVFIFVFVDVAILNFPG